jgi:hypothetical protein
MQSADCHKPTYITYITISIQDDDDDDDDDTVLRLTQPNVCYQLSFLLQTSP